MTNTLEVYQQLFEALGPQGWWPADSPWEVMIGAVLVQNTAWKNVVRAIENLREADLIHPKSLVQIDRKELSELIKPAGYYRLKAKRLQNLMHFVVDEYDSSLEAMKNVEMPRMRKGLLAVNGIGPETADSILLYVLEEPALVVDTYTHRIFARHGWIDDSANYHQLQAHLASELPKDTQIYNELHALLVYVGHHHCRRQAKCEDCPLEEMLPVGGIIELAG